VAVPASFGSVDQVDILLGNGDGSFRADGFYQLAAVPYSAVAGHFNGDKAIDLAVGDVQGLSISVLLGNGDGTFGQAVNYDTYFPTWVATGDINGDGKADLVAANAGSPGNLFASTLSVLLGNGDGTFQPGVTYPAGKRLNYVAIGDFNNDGKPDLVAIDLLGEAIITLLNTGAATFRPTSPLTFPPQLVGTAGAPMDITLTNSGEKAITVSSVTISGQPFQITETTCEGDIPPRQHCTVAVSFTAKLRGPIGGTVTFKDSASSKPQVVELVGIGTVVKVSPAKLTFPPQKLGRASAPQTVQLTNTGSVPLNVIKSFPFIYGKNRKDFSESSNCGSQVGPGASCTITVTFTPHQAGTRTAFVQIDDDGGGGSQNVPLTGTGID